MAPTTADSTVAALALAGTAAIVGLEVVLANGYVTAAIGGYLVAYAAFTLGAIRVRKAINLWISFALLAVFRLVNLSLPVFVDLTVYWIGLLYFVLVPAVLVAGYAKRIDSRPDQSATATSGTDDSHFPSRRERLRALVTKPSRRFLVTLVVLPPAGLGLGYLEGSMATPVQLVPDPTTGGVVTVALVVALVAIVEEFLFRAHLQSALTDSLGSLVGVALASLVFAGMVTTTGVAPFAIALATGLLIGTGYEVGESLLPPVLAHICLNLVVFVRPIA